MKRNRLLSQCLAAVAAGMLSACQPMSQNAELDSAQKQADGASFDPSVNYVGSGKIAFESGNYGLAETNFRQAVELNSKDAEAWLGLAASYDQLRRFDLADQAYQHLLQLVPPNAVIYNNAGYSQLLRGNVRKAKELFAKAKSMEPNSIIIANNELLINEGSN